MLLFHSNAVQLASVLITVVVAITVHEFAHAWWADRAGDPTPRAAGRLTLNPVAHFDPIGSVLFLLVGFGWAKPVPINPLRFRRPRRDGVLVAMWGPLCNFLLALAAALILRALGGHATYGTTALLSTFTLLNLNLAVFNLLPIPPLDGSHILSGMLDPRRAYEFEVWGRRFGFILLLAFLWVGFRFLFTLVVLPLYSVLIGR